MPFVYIVRCADGTLYTGYAVDVARRVDAHNAGKGARYTAGRRPVALAYVEAHLTRGSALRREHELKGLSRAAKEAIVAGPSLPDRARHASEARTNPGRARHASEARANDGRAARGGITQGPAAAPVARDTASGAALKPRRRRRASRS